MRAGLTRGLPFLLASACALPHLGCDASPPAAGAPAPAASPPAELRDRPIADPGRALSDLRLDPLFAERPRPPGNVHNPFRFGPATERTLPATPADVIPLIPAEPAAGEPPSRPSDGTATAASNAPVAAAASLRLIGVVEAGGSAGRVAVLTDERGVYHGRAGDAVEGRYRIVAVTQTTVELEDLTRGARLTLRLSGF